MNDFEEQIEAKYLAIPVFEVLLEIHHYKKWHTFNSCNGAFSLMLAKVVKFEPRDGLKAQGSGDRGSVPNP